MIKALVSQNESWLSLWALQHCIVDCGLGRSYVKGLVGLAFISPWEVRLKHLDRWHAWCCTPLSGHSGSGTGWSNQDKSRNALNL